MSDMKHMAALVFIFALSACTPAEDRQAREAADKAKVDAKEALRKAEVEGKKLSKELDADMDKARSRARKALNQPDDKKNDKTRP